MLCKGSRQCWEKEIESGGGVDRRLSGLFTERRVIPRATLGILSCLDERAKLVISSVLSN